MNNPNLYSKIEALPDDLKKEVEDFVQFLLQKWQKEKLPLSRIRGIAKGSIELKPDFDEPLDDFKEYM